jgi:hypothetical protein
MIAFRIEAGALVSCPDFGPRMRRPVTPNPPQN